MDKQIKTEWLKALRGGRYKQQRQGDLLNNNGYCCLGVLARIQGAKKKELVTNSYLEDEDCIGDTINLGKYAAGLKKKSQEVLANKNDGEDDFIQIADYIEKRYK